MKIGICDDYTPDLERLIAVLRPILSPHESLECFSHGGPLLEAHRAKPFDILFLDIEMPSINGIEAAREVRLSCQFTHIIFITRLRDYAAESYAVKAFSYLNKPFEKEDVVRVYRQARQSRLNSGRHLVIRTNYETVYLDCSHIVYAEVQRNKLRIHTYDHVFDTRMTMQELEERLEAYGFYRIHSSFLVCLDCVRSVGNKAVMLDDGTQLPMGKSKRVGEVKAALSAWREVSS